MAAMESLLRPPIGFAHRGARAHAPENTLEAFKLAQRLGATGLESDVWLTADGEAVLDHDGVVRKGLRRKSVGELRRDELPDHVPTLAELYAECGTDFDLSLDVKARPAAARAVAVARAAGGDAVRRLWLCHHSRGAVIEWRQELDPDVRLVNSTRIRFIKEGPERRAADLAAAGIDAVNLHHSDWTIGLTTLFHRFERLAFAWDCQQPRILNSVLEMGVDGVYSDHVDRMVDALQEVQR
jgi:glycerophosphoryl diester phosphodiesterase